ncbi:MAG: deoxyribonuclease IV [Lachnospiraceae bacterium]|nr:deoxyribonuclease IV [Lachnospiraceae bacterium]
MNDILLGSHVGMSGKDMFLGSVREALSYGANTFMLYTGAPQNTKRKEISELNIEEGRALMQESGIDRFVVHAPYIINLANTVKPEIFSLATDFLRKEIERTEAMGGDTLILHPGSHVGAGAEAGIAQICDGLNEVLTSDMKITISLETMAGKGSEVGRTFEELKAIFDGVKYNDKLRVCFDTCHTWDSGYDIANCFDEVMENFDKILGIDKIAVFHINDSKNEKGAAKDRHANIGDGFIGCEALRRIVHDKRFVNVPKILETPYIGDNAPYKQEIEILRK